MTVFISYSHVDKDFVDRLAIELVKKRANVWIDRWELKVGDSILNRVQSALTDANALLIVLSKASVASEWCKKELTAGLFRELEEKRTVVLPVLLEDCDLPLFLKDKLYADFRKDFDSGVKDVLDAIGAVANAEQSRISTKESIVDWAEDWFYHDGHFFIRFTIIERPDSVAMTFLTEVTVRCNERATARYRQYEAAGLDWIGRAVIAEYLFEIAREQDLRLYLDDTIPQFKRGQLKDSKSDASYEFQVFCRKLGEDNGKDQLVDVGAHLSNIKEYIKKASRQPTPEEMAKIAMILMDR